MGNIKSLLITGASQRIGAFLACYFVEKGWEVVIHFNRSISSTQALIQDLRKKGGRVHGIQGDLKDFTVLTQIMSRAEDCIQKPLTVLINNASLFTVDYLRSLTQENWDDQMDLNAKAPLFLIQSFVQKLSSKEEGHVINILDQRVLRPTGFALSYTISKFTLLGITYALARSLAPRVRVNAIAPGLILPSQKLVGEQFTEAQKKLPLSTPPSCLHIAQAIDFLIRTPCITGQVIPIDGGESLL
jgi:NAD(P)-dependent dehydrogenase (short-subunit alcohol dehydrogenase family)